MLHKLIGLPQIDIDDTESDSSAGPDPLALRPAPSPAKRPRPLPALPTAVNAFHSLQASSSHSHPNRHAPSSRDDNTPRRPPHTTAAAPSSSDSAPSPRPSASKQQEHRGSSPQVEPPQNPFQSFASVLDLTLDSGDEEAIADDPRMEQQLLEEEHDRVQEELDRRPSPFLSTPPPAGEFASPTRPEVESTEVNEESSEGEARAPRISNGKGKARKSTSSKAPVKKVYPSLSGATRPAVRESRWEEVVISSSDEDEGLVQEREGQDVTGTEEALSAEATPMEAELAVDAAEAVEAEKVVEAAVEDAEAMDVDDVQAELSSMPEQPACQAEAELDQTPMVEDATPSSAAVPAPALATAGSGDAVVEDVVDDQDQPLAIPSKAAVVASAPRATRPREQAKAGAAGAINERPRRAQKSKVAPKQPVAAVQTPKVEQDDSPAGIQRRSEAVRRRFRPSSADPADALPAVCGASAP